MNCYKSSELCADVTYNFNINLIDDILIKKKKTDFRTIFFNEFYTFLFLLALLS